MMSVGGDVDQQWDIFLDQAVNSLLLPVQSTLATATTGGSIPASVKLYVRYTTVDAAGVEGQPCVAGKTITTGSSTATNKITVSMTAVTGAVSYNIYAGTTPGYEAYAGNSITTSFIMVSLPIDATRGIPTMPDISVKLAAGVSLPLPVGGQSVLVGAHVTVFCTVGSGSGTAYFSMIGA